MIDSSQLPERFREVISTQMDVYRRGRSIQVVKHIPETKDIPIENEGHWLRIPDVISVFVDMAGSTKLSASSHDKSTAGAYQLFTGTAVRLFHEFEAPYIDVRGDGVFALFNGDQPYRAIAAAVSFKTFAELEFVPTIKTKANIDLGCHLGIDQRTVLVRKIGLKRKSGRSDRQNEVWAGRPINMSAKLASMSDPGELLVSDRYYGKISNGLVRNSCGCPNGNSVPLWTDVNVSDDDRFDFDIAHKLESTWCSKHGADFCERIIALDS